MQCGLLRVNNLPVETVRLRPRGNEFDIIIESDFGDFPLSPACLLEYLDLNLSKIDRERDPFHGWKRVTLDELKEILRKIYVQKKA